MVTKNTSENITYMLPPSNLEDNLKIREHVIYQLNKKAGFKCRYSRCLVVLKDSRTVRTRWAVEDTITLYCNEKFNFK
jgi:hypothetical protein